MLAAKNEIKVNEKFQLLSLFLCEMCISCVPWQHIAKCLCVAPQRYEINATASLFYNQR